MSLRSSRSRRMGRAKSAELKVRSLVCIEVNDVRGMGYGCDSRSESRVDDLGGGRAG